MKLDLDDRIIDSIKFIGEKYNDIDKIVIYGSRARGDNRKTSDIDIAVYCKDKSKPFISLLICNNLLNNSSYYRLI
ncbi:nucleotidyltransferase domain-containing protein [Thermoanaerobacterium thermosaccharolyticum]|jgi:predicted nucleotidyltransferase|uniref:nucleotidyltransferase domain-containing protein n=1 Tax=Thermoanaerobacterium thermosaccharolyticum TaxID=1517 RepID=UPI0001B0E401|nr:nucleotidyltransferase domain-containing protein [Thermoanaerobacterium thermosaccharolyticum]